MDSIEVGSMQLGHAESLKPGGWIEWRDMGVPVPQQIINYRLLVAASILGGLIAKGCIDDFDTAYALSLADDLIAMEGKSK